MKTYTIYKATNQVNNKVYIGFTEYWPQRINGHNYDRRYGETEHKAFYKAIKKYGWEAFEWEAIYQSQDKEHTLTTMEPHFITEYRSWVGFKDCNGYNVTLGGEGATGYKRTPELIESHRAQLKGRKQSTEHIAKRVAAWKANNNTTWCAGLTKDTDPRLAEMGRKVSATTTGRKKPPEQVAKMKDRPQDTIRLTCPHCDKEGDYKNMNRWHMDRCKHNPARVTDLEKIVTCTNCGHTAKQSPNFFKYHNEHCKGSK